MTQSGRAAAPPDERLIAGRYRVEGLLGQGGMGGVYAVVDTTTGKRIALKTTARDASATVVELFKREYQTLHGLRHPNIVEVYDFGIDETPYYTMELLVGRDLGRAAPLPWPEVCSYLRQVATLLGLLHARRLLHRDITPRNLWVLPDGTLKMIDFGALCPFGVPTEVVGTPPFIAPEWLAHRSTELRVDQRSDLYALGALAYWLLTSAHAYPARSIRELPSVWAREPAPPSSLARLVTDRALSAIPAELDSLVLSLLRSDPAGRPETTEVVIDRIDTIAGPPAESVDHAVRGYVRSKVFVGRVRERKQIGLRSQREQGGVFVIEGPSGIGRSRLLEQLALEAGLSGAARVLVRADAQKRSHGVANRLALGLLTALPREALAAAQPQAAVLAALSPEVQQLLGVQGTIARDASPRGREQLQRALTDWIFTLSASRRLLLLIDDLESSDEESAALVASFAAHCAERRLLLVAALRTEPGQELPLLLQMFRDSAQRCALRPLSAAEVTELLRSVFGSAIYLERIADGLHRAAQGNPAHCLELVEYLVDRGLARYSEGAWLLPGQLSERELPPTRGEMHLVRLAGLGVHARSLAEVLSVHDGELSTADCRALSELSEPETVHALVELTLSGVLVESESGYRFAHVSVRERLLEALEPARRKAAHGRIAASLLAAARDSVDRLAAVLHFFAAGEVAESDRLVRELGVELLQGVVPRLPLAVPLLEELVVLYRAAGRDADALAVPLTILSCASYQVDRRLADRYGLETIETLESLIHFDRARRYRRFLGRKLALLVTIIAAAIERRRRGKDALQVMTVLQMLAAVSIALNGVATSGMDLDMTARCRHALEPFEGTGDNAIIGVVRRTVDAVSSLLSDAPAATHAKVRALVAELESDKPIRDLNPIVRKEFLGGCLMTLGIMESWRQNPATLVIADRLEPLGPMHALNADQLRHMFYYLRGGERLKSEHYRMRVETHALQAGAAWQVVAIGAIGLSFAALWNHDAALAKRGAVELARLSEQLPSFRFESRRARATYLVLTGRYVEAIELMNAQDEPGGAGWLRGRSILARAYNRSGEHARAKEICHSALEGKSEEDLSFALMSLHLQIELALADAALANFEAARTRADQLLVRHAGNGIIALGTLHELRARVALIERDFETCRVHCLAMRSAFELTETTTLRELSERLWERLLEAERGDTAQIATPAALLADDAHLMTRMRLILSHTERTFERRARVGLQVAFELTGAETGFVISRAGATRFIGSDERPLEPELVRWAEAQLLDRTKLPVPEQTLDETAQYVAGEHRYCVIRLGAGNAAPALVLGFRATTPRAPGAEVLATLARHLAEAAETQQPNPAPLDDADEDTRHEPS
jgi:tetratricopeptide (TPR) repeat protein